ncbi:hypothetical protein Leryth_010981 [Lithospermum erythrorhizon]|uniref:Senescence regulator n=1 Tax=Lithospermum erythrorhizon TaxID=34254 RepID=A0AAV3PF03_LITER|nr:hypothetical protein Leryth_010981 [Lithospermum erythrorhizon]
MAEEEFQECEVMFLQDHVEAKEIPLDLNYSRGFKNDNNGISTRGAKRKKLKKNTTMALSIPVKIPDGKKWLEYDYGGGDGEFVPPHLIIRQRLAMEMVGFSVCFGKGRTLKGRDLSEVRNSILRMTGFLES